ncbi:MAG: hypothetical protein QXM96_00740 [Candidatus Woesearchaeota archaeon]
MNYECNIFANKIHNAFFFKDNKKNKIATILFSASNLFKNFLLLSEKDLDFFNEVIIFLENKNRIYQNFFIEFKINENQYDLLFLENYLKDFYFNRIFFIPKILMFSDLKPDKICLNTIPFKMNYLDEINIVLDFKIIKTILLYFKK